MFLVECKVGHRSLFQRSPTFQENTLKAEPVRHHLLPSLYQFLPDHHLRFDQFPPSHPQYALLLRYGNEAIQQTHGH